VSTLAGKRVLVTGGSRGIGRATALAFAQAGAAVAFNYSRSEDHSEAAETLAALRAAGVPTFSSCADVGDAAAVTQLFAEARDALGGTVDVLVNNAAVTQDAPLMMMKDESWDRVLDVDLRGVFLCCRAALRGMIGARWGRSSTGLARGLRRPGGGRHYAAAKAGVLGSPSRWRAKWRRFGITVMRCRRASSKPGWWTRCRASAARNRTADPARSPRDHRRDRGRHPVRGVPAASYMTGSTVHVDGGLAMR